MLHKKAIVDIIRKRKGNAASRSHSSDCTSLRRIAANSKFATGAAGPDPDVARSVDPHRFGTVDGPVMTIETNVSGVPTVSGINPVIGIPKVQVRRLPGGPPSRRDNKLRALKRQLLAGAASPDTDVAAAVDAGAFGSTGPESEIGAAVHEHGGVRARTTQRADVSIVGTADYKKAVSVARCIIVADVDTLRNSRAAIKRNKHLVAADTRCSTNEETTIAGKPSAFSVVISKHNRIRATVPEVQRVGTAKAAAAIVEAHIGRTARVDRTDKGIVSRGAGLDVDVRCRSLHKQVAARVYRHRLREGDRVACGAGGGGVPSKPTSSGVISNNEPACITRSFILPRRSRTQIGICCQMEIGRIRLTRNAAHRAYINRWDRGAYPSTRRYAKAEVATAVETHLFVSRHMENVVRSKIIHRLPGNGRRNGGKNAAICAVKADTDCR